MEINEQLKAEMWVLAEQLSVLHEAHEKLQTEICNVLEDSHFLSKTFCDMKEEKKDAFEGENSEFLAKALKLDHLFIFFKSLSTREDWN